MLPDHPGLWSAAARVEKAVENALKQGKVRIYDVGSSSKLTQMGSAVANEILRLT